jgi:phosphonopyruvate decarboxylase
MQNSGLGNAINPILSLCEPAVYSIPMIIVVGWRGEPGIKDEPQHIKQGKVQLDLMKALDLPYEIISKNENDLNAKISKGIKLASTESRPFLFIVKKGTFSDYNLNIPLKKKSLLNREKVLDVILDEIPNNSVVISTTGKTSREIFELRVRDKVSHHQDFLTVGSMGHCSSIALGIAISNPKKKIICIDGDGSLIMHMGSLSTIGNVNPKNFIHILINNYVHESVGGQHTSSKYIDMKALALANSYRYACTVKKLENLNNELSSLFEQKGPSFLEIIVEAGSRKDLGRPTLKPNENKKIFMNFLIDSK